LDQARDFRAEYRPAVRLEGAKAIKVQDRCLMPRHRYLFETRRFGPFTTRRIQQIVQGYREMAGITQPLHPHLFRHQMLTYLTSKGLTDAQIQLISGHQSKKSLEIYQHLSLQSVDKAYQEAVLNAGI
jgi:site-specific recombinase XerD